MAFNRVHSLDPLVPGCLPPLQQIFFLVGDFNPKPHGDGSYVFALFRQIWRFVEMVRLSVQRVLRQLANVEGHSSYAFVFHRTQVVICHPNINEGYQNKTR